MEAIVTLQFNGTDVTYDTAYMRSSNAVSLCPEMPLSPRNVPGRA